MLGHTALFIEALAAYACIGLISAGYVLRSPPRPGWLEVVVAAVIWPLYWLVYVGPTEVLRRLMAAFFTEDGAILVFGLISIYCFVVLMFPAYYIAKTWNSCSEFGCFVIVMKAVIWAPFWPAYVAAALTN